MARVPGAPVPVWLLRGQVSPWLSHPAAGLPRTALAVWLCQGSGQLSCACWNGVLGVPRPLPALWDPGRAGTAHQGLAVANLRSLRQRAAPIT